MGKMTVPAIFDGERIRLLEAAPVGEPYRVLVTFVEPAREEEAPRDEAPFWESFGAWRDGRPVEHTLRDIHDGRRSRSEPPAL